MTIIRPIARAVNKHIQLPTKLNIILREMGLLSKSLSIHFQGAAEVADLNIIAGSGLLVSGASEPTYVHTASTASVCKVPNLLRVMSVLSPSQHSVMCTQTLYMV